MNKYELMVILSNNLADEAKESLVNKISAMLEANGTKIESVEKVGTKKYAYAINFKNEGYYVLFNIECEAKVPNLVQKQLLLNEDVVRSMFVKKTI
ncbi:MAG: 30S ribosomal protein S6 [Christensenellales bacterium]